MNNFKLKSLVVMKNINFITDANMAYLYADH